MQLTDADGAFASLPFRPALTPSFSREPGSRRFAGDGMHIGAGFSADVHQRLDIAPVDHDLTLGPAGSNRRGRATTVATSFEADQLASLPGTH